MYQKISSVVWSILGLLFYLILLPVALLLLEINRAIQSQSVIKKFDIKDHVVSMSDNDNEEILNSGKIYLDDF